MFTLNLETLLAIDCSASACSVAVFSDGSCLANRFEQMARGQSEKLVPMIGQVISEAELEYSDVSAVAVTVGPGSFTGLRIAIATAKGISLAANVPLIGINSLQLMAYGGTTARLTPDDAMPADEILAVLDTKRGDIYAQSFSGKCDPLNAPSAMGVDQIVEDVSARDGPVTIVGDAGDEIFRHLRKTACRPTQKLDEIFAPDAALIGSLCKACPSAVSRDISPLYIRPPEAKLPSQSLGR